MHSHPYLPVVSIGFGDRRPLSGFKIVLSEARGIPKEKLVADMWVGWWGSVSALDWGITTPPCQPGGLWERKHGVVMGGVTLIIQALER